jgi:Ca2+-binding RTX toxin-like protein
MGGIGLDSLIGGTGNDTYNFAKGDGIDTINDDGTTSDAEDTVLFDSSVLQSEYNLVEQ